MKKCGLEEVVTDEHISLNMREHIEEIVREILHDINNTVTAALASSDMANGEYDNSDQPHANLVKSYFRQVREGLDHATRTNRELQLLIKKVREQRTPGDYSYIQTRDYAHRLNSMSTMASASAGYLKAAQSLHSTARLPEQERTDFCLKGALSAVSQMQKLIGHARYVITGRDTEYVAVRTRLIEPVEGAMLIYSSSLKKEGIGLELTREMLQGSPREFYFMGDSLRMTQVIINILSNMKHELAKVSTPLINISIIMHPEEIGYARISVANNGPRIKDTEEIFEQGKSGRNSSGLGLPICRNIVGEKFGGRIYARNTRGGVAFYIEVPTVV